MIFETDWINFEHNIEIYRSFLEYIQLNKTELCFFNFYYKITRNSKVKFGLDIQPGISFSYFVFSYNGLDSRKNLSSTKLKIVQKSLKPISGNIQALIIKSRIYRTKPNKFLLIRFYKTRPSLTAIKMNKIIITGEKNIRTNTGIETLDLIVPQQLNFDYVRYIL